MQPSLRYTFSEGAEGIKGYVLLGLFGHPALDDAMHGFHGLAEVSGEFVGGGVCVHDVERSIINHVRLALRASAFLVLVPDEVEDVQYNVVFFVHHLKNTL